ncbi:MAG: tRNA (adenosine(37)-N6)-threonylcarbamoyltransferase complex ATPase subunit type 1 TsaE, partial [Bacteroidia bacterium]
KLFHFDLYRLRSAEELFDIGFEEYANGSSYCFIEWPELALDLLPSPFLNVKINTNGDRRMLEASVNS